MSRRSLRFVTVILALGLIAWGPDLTTADLWSVIPVPKYSKPAPAGSAMAFTIDNQATDGVVERDLPENEGYTHFPYPVSKPVREVLEKDLRTYLGSRVPVSGRLGCSLAVLILKAEAYDAIKKTNNSAYIPVVGNLSGTSKQIGTRLLARFSIAQDGRTLQTFELKGQVQNETFTTTARTNLLKSWDQCRREFFQQVDDVVFKYLSELPEETKPPPTN